MYSIFSDQIHRHIAAVLVIILLACLSYCLTAVPQSVLEQCLSVLSDVLGMCQASGFETVMSERWSRLQQS